MSVCVCVCACVCVCFNMQRGGNKGFINVIVAVSLVMHGALS